MGDSFFEGLNFTNDQHPRISRNLRTSKTKYTVYEPGFNTDKYGLFTENFRGTPKNRGKRESLAQRIFHLLRS